MYTESRGEIFRAMMALGTHWRRDDDGVHRPLAAIPEDAEPAEDLEAEDLAWSKNCAKEIIARARARRRYDPEPEVPAAAEGREE